MLHPLWNEVAHAMRTLLELDHLHGHAELFEVRLDRARHLDGRATVDAVVRGVNEENRRRVFAKCERGFLLPPMPLARPAAKSGRLLSRSIGSAAFSSPGSKFAARFIARLAPAE